MNLGLEPENDFLLGQNMLLKTNVNEILVIF